MATKNEKKDARNARVRARFERLKRENELAETMVYALTTMEEEHAVAWGRRAKTLSEGMSAASIKRAQKRAHKIADEAPPGHVKAMEAMDLFEDMCREYGIARRDEDTMWGAVAQLCMFQLAAGRGPFYEAARDFRLMGTPPRPVSIGVVIDRSNAERDPNCNCPNCRPRKPEELN